MSYPAQAEGLGKYDNSGDLNFAVTQTPVEKPSVKAGVKNFQMSKITKIKSSWPRRKKRECKKMR